jgi:hypothetical protein
MTTPWGQLFLRTQRALAIEWMNRAVEIAKLPISDQPKRLAELNTEVQRVKSSRSVDYTTTLPVLVLPALTAAYNANSRFQAELGTSILLIAAERQRRKTGNWPRSLESIDRSILPDAPLDPCTGKPFLMKQTDGQLVIYSLGANLKDDAGVYDPKSMDGGDDVNAIGWDLDRRRQPAP